MKTPNSMEIAFRKAVEEGTKKDKDAIKAKLFGVKENINAKCGKCGEENPLGISFRQEFFIPKFKF